MTVVSIAVPLQKFYVTKIMNDVDLLYHYNMSVSLFSVSGLSSFKEHIFQGIPFSGSFLSKYHICNTEYVLNI